MVEREKKLKLEYKIEQERRAKIRANMETEAEKPEPPEPEPERDNDEQNTDGAARSFLTKGSAASALIATASAALHSANKLQRKSREPKRDELARAYSCESDDAKDRWDISHARIKFLVRLLSKSVSL